MKRFFPFLILILATLWLALSFLPPKKAEKEIDLAQFGKVPVLVGGRIKPLDTVARNSLLIIRSKETLRLDDGRQLSALKWFADMFFKASVADQYPSLSFKTRRCSVCSAGNKAIGSISAPLS